MNKFLSIILIILFLACSNKNNSDYFISESENNYWTNDLKEIEIVMSYILDYKDYKIMSKLTNEDKLEYINNFFLSIDPDTTTTNNESLDELERRVEFSKKNFSESDGGLLSDRAKIYIVYGNPLSINETYINNSDSIVWEYEINNEKIEFHFIMDSFGRYKIFIDDFN